MAGFCYARHLDVLAGFQKGFVEGIRDRGWVLSVNGCKKNSQYIHGRLFRLMANTREALFLSISPIHYHRSYSAPWIWRWGHDK